MAHAEAEEAEVYPTLRRKDAIDEHEAEHGEEEHAEGNQALLAVLEAERLEGEEFDDLVEELAGTVNHHLTEEELTILNPARDEVAEDVRPRRSARRSRGAQRPARRRLRSDRERPRDRRAGRARGPARRGLTRGSGRAEDPAGGHQVSTRCGASGASSISPPPSGACSIQRVPSASTGRVTNPTW